MDVHCIWIIDFVYILRTTVCVFSDLSNATFVPVGPPHGVSNDHPSYGGDFPGPPFDGSGRVIYPGDSYRTTDADMYNPAPSPDFASTVSNIFRAQKTFAFLECICEAPKKSRAQ